MDKTFVVSYINFRDNDLTSEIVKAKNGGESIGKHSRIESDWFDATKSLKEIKMDFFDFDAMVEVIEIESS